jgi:excinuclease UvrABC nuclease subunit
MYYIYRFYNKNHDIIYVGKTIDLKQRFMQHKQKYWWYEVVYIDVAVLDTKLWWDIYEQYYINKHRTAYNKKDTKFRYTKFEYPELEFVTYNQLF